MLKAIKCLPFIVILFLSSCNQPSPEPDGPVADTESPPPTEIIPEPTQTDLPADTPPPPTIPAEPTPDIAAALTGEPIPLIAGGEELTIHEISMITEREGWAVTRIDPGVDHILNTGSRGNLWQDVSPPQPINENDYAILGSAGYVDQNTAFVNYTQSDLVWTTHDGGRNWVASLLSFDSRFGSMFAVYDQDHAWLFQFLEGGMSKVYTAVYRTTDGGRNWETILDPYSDGSIQSFEKTGVKFIDQNHGWLTRDSMGVAAYVDLDVTTDGGESWQQIELPPPFNNPNAFKECACGLFNPFPQTPLVGSVRLRSRCSGEDGQNITDYLYTTVDGGNTWESDIIPSGELYQTIDGTYFSTSRDIYISIDGGKNWLLNRSVNWDGQFSFIDLNHSWAVAYDWEDDEYALVKSNDGTTTFDLIQPAMLPSPAVR